MKISIVLCAVLSAVLFLGCGDSSESNAKDSRDSSVKIAESKSDSRESSAIQDSSESSAKDSNATQSSANPQKSPQDLYKKCIACHGANGDKVAPGSAGNVVIADLDKKTLIADLKGYRAKTLSKGGTAAIMYLQANGLSDGDIEILGEYISGFKK